MKTYRILSVTVAAGLMLGLSACGDSKNPLGADTDDKQASEGLTDDDGSNSVLTDPDGGAIDVRPPIDDGTTYEVQNSMIVVATSEADINQLIEFTQDRELNERLMAVDLADNVVVAVFRGEMRSAGYGIDVEDVRISEGVVEITVSLTDPPTDTIAPAVITNPVAVHVVSRRDLADIKATDWVALTAEGEVLAKFRYGSGSSGGQVDGSSGGVVVTDGISDGYSIDPDGDLTPGVVIDDGGTIDPAIDPPPVDGGEEPTSSLDHADIRGQISSLAVVESDNGVVAQILVEGQIEDDTSFDRALISITTRMARVSRRRARGTRSWGRGRTGPCRC